MIIFATYSGVLLASIIISYLINNYLINISSKLNLSKTNKSGIRWGSQTKPIIGGFSFYISFLLVFIFYFIFFDTRILMNNMVFGLLLAATTGFFMGVSDDMIGTQPLFKLFIQFLIAVIFIQADIYITISDNSLINYTVTAFWVILIMNSINMLDNMDAVSALISVSILASCLIVEFILQPVTANIYSFFLIAAIGALIAYLFFNWPPSKIYMGDNGSQFLGVLLAAAGIICIWNKTAVTEKNHIYKQIISIVLIFIIPLSDTFTVVINRIMKGKSPFIGGKDHTTHHLSYAGLSVKQIVMLLFSVSLISAAISLFIMFFIPVFKTIHIFLFSLYAIIIFLLLYINTRISKPD